MKKIILGLCLSCIVLFGADNFDKYLSKFNAKERNEMKIQTPDMLNMLEEGKAILVDIRTYKEHQAWNMGFAKHIPLNELPKRLGELPKDKLIITACPHNDRANMARLYLKLKGYNARYLSDGLLKTTDYLKGDNAEEFIDELNKEKTK